MSRIGKNPVIIPNGVTVTIQGQLLTVKGPKGELKKTFNDYVVVKVDGQQLVVTRKDDTQQSRSSHGLSRTLIVNMIEGVTKGFEKKMEIIGVGYRAVANKNKITLSLGYSKPIEYIAPKEVEFKMDEEKKNIIFINCIDKQLLGEVAAKIRSFRKPEPYKGKGIRYENEHIVKKAGKSAAGAGASAGGAK
ncbi:MAG: 50S ribosomal protein L6 [Candidatus Gracilibacteria bacterium]|jgi:large subunit ribosomal protein L6